MSKNLGLLKSLAHDLAHHLDNEIWFGKYKGNFSKDFETDITEMKNNFDKDMFDFFKKRMPKSLEISKISSIVIKIIKKKNKLNITINIKFNNKMISYESKSISLEE